MQTKQRGQVMVLFAAGLVVLMAMVALAIDGGNAFSDRRQAQNAADAAAYAGAVAGTQDSTTLKTSIYPIALQRAAENGYVDTNKDEGSSGPDADVIVNYPPKVDATHAGDLKYVEVIIVSNVKTFFASVIGFDALTNRVQSVAYFYPGKDEITFAGQTIVAMRPSDPNCPAGITVQGNTNINITGGGMFSNSNSTTCAYKSDNCPTITITGGGITSVGNYKINDSCSNSTTINYVTGAKQLQYPPQYDPPNYTCTTAPTYTKDEADPNIYYVYPGTYSIFPPNIPGNNKTVIITSGTYCVTSKFAFNSGDVYHTLGWEEGTTYKSPNTNVEEGVFFYVAPSTGGFTWNGGVGLHLDALPLRDKDGNIIWNPDDPSKPISQPLVYVDPGPWPYPNNPPNCIINGNNYLTLQGQIYAPYCMVTINGDATTGNDGTINSQIIGYEVKLSGGGFLNVLYNDDSGTRYYEAPIIQQVK